MELPLGKRIRYKIRGNQSVSENGQKLFLYPRPVLHLSDGLAYRLTEDRAIRWGHEETMPGRMRPLLASTSRSGCYWWKTIVVMVLLLNSGAAWAQGKIYTWTDKNGVVHFSDSVSSPQDFGRAKALATESRQTMPKGKGNTEEIPLVTFADRPSQKFVRAQLESGRGTRDVLMLVDTGAQISLVDQQTAKDLELEHVEEATLRGVNGVTQSWIGRLPSLRVGEEEIRDLRVLVGPQPGLVLLGMDVLDRLKLSVGPQSLHRR